LENDGNATLISSITISPGSTFNDADFGDWTKIIAGATLEDDEAGPNIAITPNITSNTIEFTLLPFGAGQIGYVADNMTKVYSLKIWLKDSLDFRLSNFAFPVTITVDDKNLEFAIDESDMPTDVNGSSFLSLELLESGNANNIEVDATDLDFTIQPPDPASVNTAFPVRVEARDTQDNRDLEFNESLDGINPLGTFGSLILLNAPHRWQCFYQWCV